MIFPKIFLKPKEETDARQGFPWVFDNEIDAHGSMPRDGELCEAFSSAGLFLGTGIYNGASKISVRLLTRERAGNFRASEFFAGEVRRAYDLRKLWFSENDSFRLVFAEADFIPGLIVDRFVDVSREKPRVILAAQFLALAAERFREEIVAALADVAAPDAMYERSDAEVRLREGLEKRAGWLSGGAPPDEIIIEENGVRFYVDIAHGQKTGFFLDQKRNRRVVAELAKGRRVLDLFSHTGAFGLCAAKGGAREVLASDISREAVDMIEKNIALNGAENVMRAEAADAFEALRRFESRGEKFDLVILDPPAFAKSAKSIDKAYGGYKEINMRAMKIIEPGGILVTSSCSHFFDAARFYAMLHHAALDARARIQILQKRGAAEDHPVLAGYSKSEYLKCAVIRLS
jgi:23S rRNA (cytosine1962-C5)-methyltransferase